MLGLRRYTATLLLFLRFALLLSLAQAQGPEYKPISTLNTTAYIGRWYQMYTTFCFTLLELGGDCTTADYTLRDDGKISLINQARPPLIPQIFARTTGYVAQSPDSNNQGSFTVSQGYLFQSNPANTVYQEPGNYWIIGLGPMEGGQYQWAVVSVPNKTTFWVIARDPFNFPGSQEEVDALAVLDSFGFNRDDYVPSLHGEVCGDYS